MHTSIISKRVASNRKLEAGSREYPHIFQSAPYPDIKSYFKEKKAFVKQEGKKCNIAKLRKKKDYKKVAGEFIITPSSDLLDEQQRMAFFQDADGFLKEEFAPNEILFSALRTHKKQPALHVLVSYFDKEDQRFDRKKLAERKLTDPEFLNGLLHMKVGEKHGFQKPQAQQDMLGQALLDVRTLQQQLDDQRSYSVKVEELLQTQKNETAKKVQQLHDMQTHLSEQERSYEELEQKQIQESQQLRQQLTDRQEELSSLQAQLNDAKQQHGQTVQELESKLEAVEKELAEKSESNAALEAEKQRLQELQVTMENEKQKMREEHERTLQEALDKVRTKSGEEQKPQEI